MMKFYGVLIIIILIFSSCSKPSQRTIEPRDRENTYQITVNNNQVGYETVKRERIGDTIVLISFQSRPYRLRPISYDSKLILIPGYATWQIYNYTSVENLPGQNITFKLRFDKPWIILLQNSVISSPRYWNSDPKDPDGPAVIEWDRAFLLEALLNRYNINDTSFQRVQDVPVLIPSAFGEWGNVSIELLSVSGDTADFKVVYHREIEVDSLLMWSEDSVLASIRAIMPTEGVVGRLLQARVNLPSGIVLSIFEDDKAEEILPEPFIRAPEISNYSVHDDSFTGADGVKLVGSFFVPDGEGPFPGILFLHSNIASDRYEMGVFRFLGDKLAKNGFIIFTYDKRGVGASDGSYDSLHYGILSGDAYLAFEKMYSHRDIDERNVFILGHGEGGLISMDIASDPLFKDRLAGIITMGTTALNPIDSGNIELMMLQAETWDWSEERLDKQIEDLKEGLEFLRTSSEYWREIPGFPGEKENLAYARSFLDFDPLDKISNLKIPMLILHGEIDRFVSSENAERLAEEAENGYMVIFPQIDNNFAFSTIEGKDGFRESFVLPEDYGADISLSDTIITWLDSIISEE